MNKEISSEIRLRREVVIFAAKGVTTKTGAGEWHDE